MVLGIALAGGGVQGAAHAGVLRAFEEAGIRPNMLAGTSSGAIIASLYACGYGAEDIRGILRSFVRVDKRGKTRASAAAKRLMDVEYGRILAAAAELLLFRRTNIPSIVKGGRLRRFLEELYLAKGVYALTDVKIPLSVSAVDLNSGKLFRFSNLPGKNVITDAPLAKAVMASAAFPAFFRTQRYKAYSFTDGGVLDNLPVECLREMGAAHVVGVAFKKGDYRAQKHKSFIDAAMRSVAVLRETHEALVDRDIDTLIEIPGMNASLLEISKALDCYERGYQEGKRRAGELKARLRGRV
jgi:NTE family protein